MSSFLLVASDAVIVPAVVAANKVYDDVAVKGAVHPHGARRTSLAAGFRNRVSEVDLSKADGEAATCATHCGQIAQVTKTITLAEQKVLLVHVLKSFDTAQKVEPDIAAFLFFKCKKQSKDSKEDSYFFCIGAAAFFVFGAMSSFDSISLDGRKSQAC